MAAVTVIFLIAISASALLSGRTVTAGLGRKLLLLTERFFPLEKYPPRGVGTQTAEKRVVMARTGAQAGKSVGRSAAPNPVMKTFYPCCCQVSEMFHYSASAGCRLHKVSPRDVATFRHFLMADNFDFKFFSCIMNITSMWMWVNVFWEIIVYWI